MTSPVAFKATRFRVNTSTQYADQLWLKNISTVATPDTLGQTDSVKAAYLPDGNSAIPSVFGTMTWKAPLEASPSECSIKLYDSSTSTMETVATMTQAKAQFSGWMASNVGMEIGSGTSAPWHVTMNPTTGSLVFSKYNPSTGVYDWKHEISA